MKYPIPEYPPNQKLYLLCWPDSVEWQTILWGLITSVERGRFWDETTGNIRDTQQYAKENINLMTCDELILVLQQIRDGVNAIEVRQGDILIQNTAQASAGQASATASAELNALVVAQSQAIALAQSWSQSIATATASAVVRNDVQVLLPYFEPTEPPSQPVLDDGGFNGAVVPFESTELCDRATWAIDFAIGWMEYIITSRVTAFSTGVFSVVTGYLGSKLALAAGSVPHPVARAAAVVGAFMALLASGLTHQDLLDALQDVKNSRSFLICILYQELFKYSPTQVARDTLLLAVADVSQNIVPLFAAIIDASLIGMMYLRFTTENFPPGSLDVCNGCSQ